MRRVESECRWHSFLPNAAAQTTAKAIVVVVVATSWRRKSLATRDAAAAVAVAHAQTLGAAHYWIPVLNPPCMSPHQQLAVSPFAFSSLLFSLLRFVHRRIFTHGLSNRTTSTRNKNNKKTPIRSTATKATCKQIKKERKGDSPSCCTVRCSHPLHQRALLCVALLCLASADLFNGALGSRERRTAIWKLQTADGKLLQHRHRTRNDTHTVR